jgi:uncharacterized protein
MLKIGDYNTLKVEKFVDFGLYLQSDEGEILLPKKYMTEDISVGDMIEVFIYRDSEDRLIATNLKPLAKVGEFAALQVKDTTQFGAFLEWGLEKDLLVPFNEQKRKMEVGRTYVVYVLIDPKTERVIATSKISAFLNKKNIELKNNEEVDLLIFDQSELGYSAIIDNKYSGMLYRNEVFRKIQIGDRLKGYVKQVREDNKIDLTLNKPGMDSVDDAKDLILKELEKNKGFLNLTDSSDPEDIKEKLQMSKKTFKKAIGGLYKEQKITLEPHGISLAVKK